MFLFEDSVGAKRTLLVFPVCRSRWPICEFHRSKIGSVIVTVSNLIITVTTAVAAISNTSRLRRLYYGGTLIPIILADSQLFLSSLTAELSDDSGKLVLDVEFDTSLTTVALSLLRTSKPTWGIVVVVVVVIAAVTVVSVLSGVSEIAIVVLYKTASVCTVCFCDWFFFFFFFSFFAEFVIG